MILIDGWIQNEHIIYQAAGYSCYEWLLGSRKDEEFVPEKIEKMIERIKDSFDLAKSEVQESMSGFLGAAALSYLTCSTLALDVLGGLDSKGKERLQREIDKGRLGFKRKNVRC